MKIGYITESFSGSKGNGITSQAITWYKLLTENYNDIEVVLINPWESYDLRAFDIIHLFGCSNMWFYDVTRKLKNLGIKVVWSPICDNIDKPSTQKIKATFHVPFLKLISLPYIRKKEYELVDKVFVRSNYEKRYIEEAYGVPNHKFAMVRLAMSYNDKSYTIAGKEDFCLHISSIYQQRKNVIRLIEAAKKYGFKLVLAGNKGGDKDFKPLCDAIGDASNIKVLGFISEEEKLDLYKRAHVFALPSIMEGVGIVALDAAHFGCNVVITELGGPKEYYDIPGRGTCCVTVNPFSVDSIGKGVLQAMKTPCSPVIKTHVDDNFSESAIGLKLVKAYEEILTC